MNVSCPYCGTMVSHHRSEKCNLDTVHYFACSKCGAEFTLHCETQHFEKILIQTLKNQEKIRAIKIYRERFGTSLKDSKDAIDTLQGALLYCGIITPF